MRSRWPTVYCRYRQVLVFTEVGGLIPRPLALRRPDDAGEGEKHYSAFGPGESGLLGLLGLIRERGRLLC